jgi:hypothetical protein
MLTATAVCRRAPSINVRISINNLGDSWPFRSRSRCGILPLSLCSPVLVLKWTSINAPGSLGGSALCLMNLSQQWKHFVLMTTKSGPLGLYSLGQIGSVARRRRRFLRKGLEQQLRA